MQSKKKVYQFKPILKPGEAVEYLSELVKNKLDANDLIELGQAHGLRALVSAGGIDFEGLRAAEVGTGREVTPVGLHEVSLAPCLAWASTHNHGFGEIYHSARVVLDQEAPIFKGQNDKGEAIEWQILGDFDPELEYEEGLLFKPADIQALADKLNGKPPVEVQREELTALRERVQELEQENADLKAHGAVAGGLTFPYSTPELEAMQQAANHYWAGYSEELCKPTQTEIGAAIAEALGAELTAEKRPPRKASQYATAIQPEQYREA